MPNPGAFSGSRKEFLMGERPAYSLGVAGGYAPEALAVIQQRYFKRFPLDLPDDVEPSAESLAVVNDDAPDPEFPAPDQLLMSPEEYAAAMLAVEARQKALKFKKGQIKRWLIYQHVKENDSNPTKLGPQNPFAHLIAKLSGAEICKPRAKTAVNLWRKDHKAEIDEEAKAKSKDLGLGKSDHAALRDSIARQRFSMLPKEEQQKWAEAAQLQHAQALEAWQKEIGKGFSSDPADRQRAIQALVHFVQPFLDAICEATGWKATLFAGGPEPAQEGRLNVISVHSGTTTGDVKMTFGRAERVDIKRHIIPIFGKFLQKCYSPEECRSRALLQDNDLLPMSLADFDDEATGLHPIQHTTAEIGSHLQPAAPSLTSTASTTLSSSATAQQSSEPTPASSIPSGLSSTAISLSPPALQEQSSTETRSGSSSAFVEGNNPFPYEIDGIINDAPPSERVHSRPASPFVSRPASPAPSPPRSPVSQPVSRAPSPPGSPGLCLSQTISPRPSNGPAPPQSAEGRPFFDSAQLSAAIAAARRVTSGVHDIVRNAILAPADTLPCLDVVDIAEQNSAPHQVSDVPASPPAQNAVSDISTSRRSNRLAAAAVNASNSKEISTAVGSGNRKRGRKPREDVQVSGDPPAPPVKRARANAAQRLDRPVTRSAAAAAPKKRGQKRGTA